MLSGPILFTALEIMAEDHANIEVYGTAPGKFTMLGLR